MKRNLWSDSHRRSGPEAFVQHGATAASRSATERLRPAAQRRNRYIDDNDSLLERFATPAKPGRAETGQPGKSEFQRLREEVLDIAQELKGLRHREPTPSDVAGYAARPARQAERRRTETPARPHEPLRSGAFAFDTRPKYQGPPAARQAAPDPAPAGNVRAPDVRARPSAQHPHVRDEKPRDLVDPAHRNVRPDGIAPVARATPPARAEAPQPVVVPRAPVRPAPAQAKTPVARTSGRSFGLGAKLALLALLMLAGTGLITLKLWGGMPGLQAMHAPVMSWLTHARQNVADVLGRVSPSAANALSAARETPPQTSTILTTGSLPAPARQIAPNLPFAAPDTYGVYAVSDGQLVPLEALPIRVPDARVSFSNTISKPAPAPAANGRLSFVVYHRELATSVPETASVRIVAKVMQATAFAGGKPRPVAVEDTWAVRGGAIDLRIAPVAGNPEMIVVRPADPNFTLSPGRYVLMFRNQAYDFSVAGTVSETAQCLERADTPDGSVFSECRQLPARPISY